MNSTEIIRVQIDSTYRSIRANTGDISDEEALITPEGGGNSINWILGHILLNRNELFAQLKRTPSVDTERYHSYRRGGKGVLETWTTVPFSEIRQSFDQSQNQLLDALKMASIHDDAARRIAQMCYHEAYHAGQIGIMRRVIGKPGVIKKWVGEICHSLSVCRGYIPVTDSRLLRMNYSKYYSSGSKKIRINLQKICFVLGTRVL